MSIVSDAITNLFNGVSQQPAELRDPSQFEEQLNFESNMAKGLMRRPPVITTATMQLPQVALDNDVGLPAAFGPNPNCFTYLFDRSPTEKWMLVITPNGQIRMVPANGGAMAPVVQNNYTTSNYLSFVSASSIKALLVADTLFLVNTEKTVSVLGTPTLRTINGSVSTFGQLPAATGSGQCFKVTGSNTDGFTAYYVYDQAPNTWIETGAQSIAQSFDPGTMPQVLYRTGANDFTCSYVNWGFQTVGDLQSIPYRSFVNRQLAGVFFHRNRLGLFTRSSIVMSRPGDYYNFFPKSAATVSDDDPIDATVAHPKAPVLLHAATYSKLLVLFGDTVQFTLEGGDVLSPRSVSINPITEYNCSSTVAPVGLGPNVYFTQAAGSYSKVRELFITNDKASSDAFDVTQHVPTLLPNPLLKCTASGTENTLVFTMPNSPEMYVYKTLFDYSGSKRLQSSWSKWTVPKVTRNTQILGAHFSESVLYLLIARGQYAYVETMRFDRDRLKNPYVYQTDATLPQWVPHLDHVQYADAGSYNSATNRTPVTMRLPHGGNYAFNAWEPWTAFSIDERGIREIPFETTATSGNNGIINLVGDYSGAAWLNKIMVGVKYQSSVTLSPMQMRDKQGNPVLGGRLQLTHVRPYFRASGDFNVVTTPLRRDPITRTFRPQGVGIPLVGSQDVETGDRQFAVGSDASTVKVALSTNSPMPLSFHSLQWTGIFAKRA